MTTRLGIEHSILIYSWTVHESAQKSIEIETAVYDWRALAVFAFLWTTNAVEHSRGRCHMMTLGIYCCLVMPQFVLLFGREVEADGKAKRTNYVSCVEHVCALFANYIFAQHPTSNIMSRNMPKCFPAHPLLCSPGAPMVPRRVAMIVQNIHANCFASRCLSSGHWVRATPHFKKSTNWKNKPITKMAARWPATSFIVVRTDR